MSSAVIKAVDGDRAVGRTDRERHLVGMIGETVYGPYPVAHETLVETYHIYAVTVEVVDAYALVSSTVLKRKKNTSPSYHHNHTSLPSISVGGCMHGKRSHTRALHRLLRRNRIALPHIVNLHITGSAKIKILPI